MKGEIGRKLTVATATVIALTMLLAGCGSSLEGAGGNASGSAVEPAAGFDGEYKGAYAMPSVDKTYDNPVSGDNVKEGGSLTVATRYTPNWNFMNVEGNTASMAKIWNFYMPMLQQYDLKGNLKWNKNFVTDVQVTSENPLTIKYEINPKAKWNNGKDIDWTAFKSTWQVNNGKDTAYSAANTDGYRLISSVEAGKDAKEAVVTFEKPYYPWQPLFSFLYSPDGVTPETYSHGWTDNPHNEWAAGPYKVASADKDGAMLERNPSWWGPKPKLDKIIYKFMEDSASLNAFKNGELDVVPVTNNNDLQMVKTRKGIQIRIAYGAVVSVFIMNGKAGPLRDINVRKAITFGTDVKLLNKVEYQGWDWWKPDTPGSQLFMSYQEGYRDNRTPEMKKGVDVAAAKTALEASGYKKGSDGYYAKNGKTLTVRYTYFGDKPTTTAIAKAFNEMMKKVGIKVNLENRDNSKWAATTGARDYEVMPSAWGADNPYGQTSLYQLYNSKSESNLMFLGNDEIDSLCEVPGTIEKQSDAVKAANRAEAEAFKLYGTFPYDAPPKIWAVRKGLANYGPAGFKTVDPLIVGWQR